MGNGVSSRDAMTSGEIFRKDHPMILACNRHQAMLLPVRLDYVSGGYQAGQVLGQITATKHFKKYDDAASDGSESAQCVLFHDCEPASGDSEMAVGIFKGQVFESKLVGLDAAGKVDLKSRSIEDATGTAILIF